MIFDKGAGSRMGWNHAKAYEMDNKRGMRIYMLNCIKILNYYTTYCLLKRKSSNNLSIAKGKDYKRVRTGGKGRNTHVFAKLVPARRGGKSRRCFFRRFFSISARQSTLSQHMGHVLMAIPFLTDRKPKEIHSGCPLLSAALAVSQNASISNDIFNIRGGKNQ